MGNLLLPLGIIVGISILSWIFQQVQKAAEDKRRQQAAPPPVVRRPGPKAGGSDIDRFLQEIDKLRGGKPGPKVAPKPPPPPPKVAPLAKKVRLGDQAAPAFKTTAAPVAESRPKPAPARKGKDAAEDDLPVAAVVGQDRATPITAAGVNVATIATIARPTDAGYRTAKTAISKRITELLANPESAAVAVALNEILGPPKCKRRG